MGSLELSSRLTFGPGSRHGNVLVSLAVAPFVTGEQPFAQDLAAEGVARASDLVPLGSVVGAVAEPYFERVLAQGDGWSVLVERYRNGHADISVSASTSELLAKAVADVAARSPVVEPEPEALRVEFWYGEANGCRSFARVLDAPAWDAIGRHYGAAAKAKIDALVAMGPPGPGGRLLLWHGPPGTGKTTAIRSLAREWAGWCRTLFIVDPEQFLGRSGYLISVLLGADDLDDDDDEGPKWRLIVIEDADELLRADAKRETGQSLSRLLNLADGFIGRGLRTLIMITTNEPLGRLHPAVVRPGRCLAEVEFPLLSRQEAAGLLDGDGVDRELSLAEVFERRGTVSRLSSQAEAGAPGQYL